MTNIFSLTCVGVFLAFWTGLIGWTLRKRLPFPWDILLAMLIFPLSQMTLFQGLPIYGGWLALFPVLVWPDSKPECYFFRWQGMGRSLGYGLLAGGVIALLMVLMSRFGPLTRIPPQGDLGWMAFVLFEFALFEELAFRGLILGSMIYRGIADRTALFVQAALFIVAFIPRFSSFGDWYQLVIIAVLGLLTGWITLRTRNISGAILAHLLASAARQVLANNFL